MFFLSCSDVIRAYKSLLSEKEALEASVQVLSKTTASSRPTESPSVSRTVSQQGQKKEAKSQEGSDEETGGEDTEERNETSVEPTEVSVYDMTTFDFILRKLLQSKHFDRI